MNELSHLDAERAELRLLMLRLERCVARSEELAEQLRWLAELLRDETVVRGPADFVNGGNRRAAS
jgi:hypothetical protein